MKKVVYYFLRGLLFLFPIAATGLLIVAGVRWMDGLLAPKLKELIGLYIPGLGIIVIFLAIVVVGYMLNFIGKPLDYLIQSGISRMPLIKIIYNGLRDFSEALIGEKKKFTQPVMVEMTNTGVMKMGFVTQEDLGEIGLDGMVAVYFPHSYNFSGNLFLAPKEKVKPLKGNATEIMKFIVSAGVMSADNIYHKESADDSEVVKVKRIKKKD